MSHAVDYFEGLLGTNFQVPDLTQPLYAYQFLRLAVPAAFVGTFHPRALPVARRVAQRVARGEEPTLAERSELEAAAFLHFCGVRSIERVPEGTFRTPDLLTQWPHGTRVEVEVTTGARRPEMDEVSERLGRISNAVHAVAPHRDVEIFLGGSAYPDEEVALAKAVVGLGPEAVSIRGEAWQIDVGQQQPAPPSEGPHSHSISFDAGETPAWFRARPALYAVALGGGGAGRTRARAPLPKERYLNPLVRKVERNQSSRKLPFIVAVDVSRMPGALDDYATTLSDYLPHWPAVSGVLVFSAHTMLWDVGWEYLFVPNEASNLRLPEHINRRLRTQRSQRTLHLRQEIGVS